MIWVTVKANEPIESAIKRFKRKCKAEGIIQGCKDRSFYTKPSVRRRQRKRRSIHR